MPSSSSKRQRSRNGSSAGHGTNGGRPRRWVWLAGGLVVAGIALVVGIAALSGPTSGGARTPATQGTVVEANGGHWTNITPDTLATMLKTKSFTLLNVKTPYMGEIAGTDLWIPYTEVAAQAAKLPPDKKALIVVYCRSGHESAIAAQALLDIGYSNVTNLDGGMTAWTDSGRDLIQVNRS